MVLHLGLQLRVIKQPSTKSRRSPSTHRIPLASASFSSRFGERAVAAIGRSLAEEFDTPTPIRRQSRTMICWADGPLRFQFSFIGGVARRACRTALSIGPAGRSRRRVGADGPKDCAVPWLARRLSVGRHRRCVGAGADSRLDVAAI